MYLTAQRVQQKGGRRHGINCFLYLHGEQSIAGGAGEQIDVDAVAEHPPRAPVAQIHSLTPGGNRVLSYLDLACDDGVEFDHLQRAVDAFQGYVPRERIDSVFEYAETIDGIGLRLYLSPHGPLSPQSEFGSLRESVLQILGSHREDGSHDTLRIARHRDADSWRFCPLSTDIELPGPPNSTEGTTMTIDDDTLDAFQKLRGPIFPVVAEAIFDRSTDELLDHGGVEIIDADTNDIIWRGP